MSEEQDSRMVDVISKFTYDELIGGVAWSRTLLDHYVDIDNAIGIDEMQARICLLEDELKKRSSGQ